MSWRTCQKPSNLWEQSYFCILPGILSILFVIAGITNVCFWLWLLKCHSFVPFPQPQIQTESTFLPYYFTSYHFICGHFKSQCIVNFCPEMRSNTYIALPTTLSIIINVSSPLHLSHTSITLLEMSNAFVTVIALWWPPRLRKVQCKNMVFFLLTALSELQNTKFIITGIFMLYLKWLKTKHRALTPFVLLIFLMCCRSFGFRHMFSPC